MNIEANPTRFLLPPPLPRGRAGWGSILLAVLASALLSFASVASADTPLIDQAALNKRIAEKDSSLIILDVRTPEEFAAGHVPGAINIPYTYFPASISALGDTSGKDIVLYCQTGVRAERAATRLRENGFSKLLHLQGDMKQWKEKEQPIEK
jgi:rhodanese-related sulfurtransferase